MDLQKIVSANLVRMRGDISRQKLAEMAGISYQHVYEIEEELKKPSLKVLEKISVALSVPVADFFIGEPVKLRSEPVSKTLVKLMAIPDDVYELAQGVPHDNEAWEYVRGILEGAKDIQKSSG